MARRHGDFDNDEATLRSTLQRICGIPAAALGQKPLALRAPQEQRQIRQLLDAALAKPVS
jgi:hypothetical protein